MTKDDIRALIEEELEQYPKATAIEMAVKLGIPYQIVQLFRNKIEKSKM